MKQSEKNCVKYALNIPDHKRKITLHANMLIYRFGFYLILRPVRLTAGLKRKATIFQGIRIYSSNIRVILLKFHISKVEFLNFRNLKFGEKVLNY